MRNKLLSIGIILLFVLSGLTGQIPKDSSFCKADFTYKIDSSIMSILPSLAVQFSNESQPDSAKYLWDFGDGNTSNEKNPFHIYSLIPKDPTRSSLVTKFTACLTIYTSTGCATQVCKTVKASSDTFPESCDVYFKYYRNDSVISIPELIPFKFIGISSQEVVKWDWDFNDGTFSKEQFPAHSFNFLDTSHNVCLTIETASGCKNTFCDEVIINPVTCKANFNYSMSKSLPPIFGFYDLSEGENLQWNWSFGDGTYSNEKNPQHVFKNPPANIFDSLGYKTNIYKVCLSIKGLNECYDTHCMEVSVPGYDTVPPTDCQYNILLNYSKVLGNNNCDGIAKASSVDNLGNVHSGVKYYWSNGSTENYTKGLCSNFPYYVIIKDSLGCETAGSFALMDYNSPLPYIGIWEYHKSGDSYEFIANNQNNSIKFEWEFENGRVQTGNSVTYSPENAVVSNKVILRVKDEAGNLLYTENIYLGQMDIQSDVPGIHKNASVKSYPNPVEHTLYIDLDNTATGEKIMAEVFNSAGKMIIQKQYESGDIQSQIQIDVKDLTKGIYIVRLNSDTKPIGTVRFIK